MSVWPSPIPTEVPDLSWIPTEELRRDRADSLEDMRVCQIAIREGITAADLPKSKLAPQERYAINEIIVERIDTELARRGEQP